MTIRIPRIVGNWRIIRDANNHGKNRLGGKDTKLF